MHKIVLYIIILIFLPFKCFAHTDHYENIKNIKMEIFKDGKVIGFNNYFFSKDNETLTIKNKTEFDVYLLKIKIFSFKSNSQEIYKNNKLLSFNSRTIQNNKEKFVKLSIDDKNQNYKIEGSSYQGTANLQIVIGSWWNHNILQSRNSISPVSGSIRNQEINFIKSEKLNLFGKNYETKKFQITSKKDKLDNKEIILDIWIDVNTNHILKIAYFKFGLWEYKLRSINYLD
tara:strand:+ start:2456 stop:3145 length:690 start_codon:yes stop_codon:yes gene_type:complete